MANTPITITAAAGSKQPWQGFGYGVTTHNGNFLDQAHWESSSALLWGALGTQNRFFFSPSGMAVTSQGVTPNAAFYAGNMLAPNGYQWEAAQKAGGAGMLNIATSFSIPSWDTSAGTSTPWTLTGDGTGPASSDGVTDYFSVYLPGCIDALRRAGLPCNCIGVLNEPSQGTSASPSIAINQWPVGLKTPSDGSRFDGLQPNDSHLLFGLHRRTRMLSV